MKLSLYKKFRLQEFNLYLVSSYSRYAFRIFWMAT